MAGEPWVTECEEAPFPEAVAPEHAADDGPHPLCRPWRSGGGLLGDRRQLPLGQGPCAGGCHVGRGPPLPHPSGPAARHGDLP
eukprot:12812440-Alexandrium_andersonii.AAC.1